MKQDSMTCKHNLLYGRARCFCLSGQVWDRHCHEHDQDKGTQFSSFSGKGLSSLDFLFCRSMPFEVLRINLPLNFITNGKIL